MTQNSMFMHTTFLDFLTSLLASFSQFIFFTDYISNIFPFSFLFSPCPLPFLFLSLLFPFTTFSFSFSFLCQFSSLSLYSLFPFSCFRLLLRLSFFCILSPSSVSFLLSFHLTHVPFSIVSPSTPPNTYTEKTAFVFIL